MVNIEIEIIEQGYTGQGNPNDYASVRAVTEASDIWRSSNYEGVAANASISSPDYYLGQDWYQSLGITRYPVVLFVASINNQLLARLSGSNITTAKVLQIILRIKDLHYDAGAGTFIYPDGSAVGQNGLLDTNAPDGGGGGLIPSDFLGGLNGSWLGLGLAAFAAYKAYNSKGDTQLLWGATGAYGLYNYANSNRSTP